MGKNLWEINFPSNTYVYAITYAFFFIIEIVNCELIEMNV